MHSMIHHYTSHAMHHGVVTHYLLQLAAARSVLLVVCTSVDVIHSWTLPTLGIKVYYTSRPQWVYVCPMLLQYTLREHH